MKKLLNHLTYFWFGFFVVFLAAGVSAQPTNGVDVLPADQKVRDFFLGLSAWQFLLAPVVGILMQGVKNGLKMISPKFIPWLGPLVGAVLDYAAAKAGFWTGNGSVGAMMGGLATWAHQAFTQPFDPPAEAASKS